ncbi:hypothetical protein [Hyphomonas sp.]|uniref:hypothetical protein n=1 Tax=Hyphomonas sp. TaxID=87 RepID=UPI0025C46A91|nr:hypothetical protein [Hyphomonas sp.]
MSKDIISRGFDSASLKVERAIRHVDELKTLIDEIRNLDLSDRITITKDADDRYVAAFKALPEEVKMLPLVIGDAIHNCRSALDHIWTALDRSISPKKNVFSLFLFHETRDNLEDAISKSPIKEAFPDTERLLLDCIKPHSDAGGDHVFWAITKFDKLDKHNMAIPIMTIDWFERIIVRTGSMEVPMQNVRAAECTNFAASDSPVELENKGRLTVTPEFPHGTVLPGKPVLPAVIHMSEATGKAVELFRESFL